MDPIELEALNIIKGEIAGDKFLWDQEWRDPKSGFVVKGVWKSFLEEQKNK